MRTILFASILALSACAGGSGRTPDEASVVREACDAAADLAERVARLHQKGVPLSVVLAKMEQIEPDPDYYAEARADVIDIYRRPRFDTVEAQESAIARVRDLAHAECMRDAYFRLSRR